MSESPTTGRGSVTRHSHPKRSLWKRFYVATLLALLPLLMKIFNATSRKVRQETTYCGEGYAFALTIAGWSRNRTVVRTRTSWRGAAAGTPVQLTIGFRDLDYAYDVFIGNITLANALAARYFTTHGPNDKAVAVTYLFTVILKRFFGWRSAYRR